MSDSKRAPDRVLLCGGGCPSCPEATFGQDGSVTVTYDEKDAEGNRIVGTLSAFQFGMLIAEAGRRGLLGCPAAKTEDA